MELSNPERKSLTPEEKRRRHWKLVSTLASFVAIYAALHKFFIPLSLKFTALASSPYADIDPWFLHPLLLAFLIHKTRSNSQTISFVSGVAVVYAPIEMIHVYQGSYSGWLAVSRLMSALPMAILSGYLMTLIRFAPRYSSAWLGAILMAGIGFLSLSESPSTTKAPTVAAISTDTPPSTSFSNDECGAKRLSISPETVGNSEAVLNIKECGLGPPILKMQGDKGNKLNIHNQVNQIINLHLVISTKKGGHRSVWNFPVPPLAEALSPAIEIPNDAIGMLYSDNSPKMGIAAITPTRLSETWQLERSPLSIRKLK